MVVHHQDMVDTVLMEAVAMEHTALMEAVVMEDMAEGAGTWTA
jgi:hypothetical protein